MSYDEAVAKAKSLGNGWELPSLELLKTIQRTLYKKSKLEFSDAYYWSSLNSSQGFSKYVRFSDGYSNDGPVTNKFNICVVRNF